MKRPYTMMLMTLAMFGCNAASDAAKETVAPQAPAPHGEAPVDEADHSVAAEPSKDAPVASAAPAEASAFGDEEARRGLGRDDIAAAPPPVGGRPMGMKPKASGDGRVWESGQSAPVQAGEWDDNANYREFLGFMESSSHLSHRRVDMRHRRFIVVRDDEGKGVPSCPVTISDGQRNVTLTTTASGRAILFPHAEGLFGSQGLSATARCADAVKTARFNLEDDDDVVDLRLDTRRSLPQVKQIEIAFILDTTGSMSEEISAVKATINKVASALSQRDLRIRVGLVEYKDQTDAFVTKIYPMTSALGEFSQNVAGIVASGGGDTPEDAVEGLRVGISGLQWSQDSVARMAFIIGDAPPHLDYQGSDYARSMRDAAHRGIKLFTVAASGMDDLGQMVWRQLAQYTGGTNMFVKRGGAGPQSTGGGDPKSSCGGTHENYRSGNLDALIVEKVEDELRAIDQSPLRIAGLRIDENAKPCNERIAQMGR